MDAADGAIWYIASYGVLVVAGLISASAVYYFLIREQ